MEPDDAGRLPDERGAAAAQRHGYPVRVDRAGALRREERQVGDADRGRRPRRQGVLRAAGLGSELRHPDPLRHLRSALGPARWQGRTSSSRSRSTGRRRSGVAPSPATAAWPRSSSAPTTARPGATRAHRLSRHALDLDVLERRLAPGGARRLRPPLPRYRRQRRPADRPRSAGSCPRGRPATTGSSLESSRKRAKPRRGDARGRP